MPFTRFFLLNLLLGFFTLVSCQQPYYGSGNVGVKDHSDAVVHINQVDPAYRGYFADQHDSNFSLKDQRKAFYEAVKTSKTPVQQDARHMSANSKKKVTRKKSSRRSSKKVVKRKSSSKKSTKKSSSKKRTKRKRR
ncbi:MAG: hypothetical protein E7033_01330 [Akkermansiaceae bacterium]|nr:hypothetical protein [Akkermansiaceae bacterium]